MNDNTAPHRPKEYGVLPDAAVLRRLRKEGKTYKEIGDLYGVTESGVWRAFERANLIKKRPTYRDIVPWNVERKFSRTEIMRHLRTMAKTKFGLPGEPKDLRAMEAWKEQMKSDGVVIAYHPEAPANPASSVGGFYYAAREPGSDDWYQA